jgi:hypothetical protein
MVRKAETPRLWVLALVGAGRWVELVLDRKFGVHDPLRLRLLQKGRQVVVVLRSHHHVHGGRPAQDLLALGLGDAARHHDAGFLALGRALVLQLTHAAEFGINLLGGLLADMAGIEDDEIRLLHGLGLAIALRGQHVRHALRVIDVHLAAIGFDENFLHRAWPIVFAGLSASGLSYAV